MNPSVVSSYLKIKKLVGDEEGSDFVGEEDEGEEEEDLEGEKGTVEVECVKKKKKLSLGEGSGKSGSGGVVVAPPCCLVENCGADLSGCKKYHQRHRVCEVHSKAPVVLVEGLRQRFCQQCSRFHELSEFDQTKRSCRRRLAGHNERRRKSTLETQKEGSRNQFRQLKERTEIGSPGNQNYHIH